MHLIEQYYYTTVNVAFLKALGIWPYDKSRIVLLQRILIIILTMTHTGMQLLVFITTRYNATLFVNIMSFVFPCIILKIKYCTFILKLKCMRNFYHQIIEDWKIIQDELENEIMQKHNNNCRMLILVTYKCYVLMSITIVITQFFPIILDMVFPLDEPRPRKLVFIVEYFVPMDKYFYSMVLHEFIISMLYLSIFLAVSSQIFILTYHSYGMFQIASYRLELITDENYLMNISNFEKERTICKKIMDVVIAHRKAVEFCDIFVACFNVSFCIMAIFGLLSLSLNLYKFVEAMIVSKNLGDMIVSFMSLVAHLIYLYVGIFMGQKLSDCNKELNRLTYNTPWYLMPVSSQKLILFLMQKLGKDFYLAIGFLLMAKMENFAAFINTAVSYVTVMYSIQSQHT